MSNPKKACCDSDLILQFRVGTTLDQIEREAIFATLEQCRGDKVEAARMLGVCERTLYNRLRRYKRSERNSGQALNAMLQRFS